MQPEILAQVVQWEPETLSTIVQRLLRDLSVDTLYVLFDSLAAQPYTESKRRRQLAPSFLAVAQQLPAVYGSVQTAVHLYPPSSPVVLRMFQECSTLYIERIIPPLREHANKRVLTQAAKVLFDNLALPVSSFKADFAHAVPCLELTARMVVHMTESLLERRAVHGGTADAARVLLSRYLSLLSGFPDRPPIIDQPVRLLTRYVFRASTMNIFCAFYTINALPADIIEEAALDCIEDPPYRPSEPRYTALFDAIKRLPNTPDHIKVAIELMLSRR